MITKFDWVCPWFCSPAGPGTPFATWYLAVSDSVRLLVLLASIAVLVLTPTALARCVNSGQRARFIALGLWAAQVLLTNTEHLGDAPGIRTVLNTVAAAYALYGMVSFLWWEAPAESRRGALHPRSD